MKSKNAAPTAWDQMLAGVEKALAQVEEEVRKQEAAGEALAAPANAPDGWQEKLDRLEEACRRLRDRLDQAEQATAAVEAVLAKHQAAFIRWLEEAGAARTRLAKGAA